MAPSASTATLLLLLSFLVAAATSPSRQTAHAARDLVQEAEAASPPGVPGSDGAPGPATAEEPWSELVHEWELGFVAAEAPPPAASPSLAQAPAGSVSTPATGLLWIWRKMWWFDEPYLKMWWFDEPYLYRPAPGSKNQY